MRTIRFSLATLLLLLAAFFSAGVHAAPAQGAVIQVTDESKLNMALTNAINTSKVMPRVMLEVVVYGAAITLLQVETPIADKLEDAKRHGIKIVVCEESMHGKQLTKDDMHPGLHYVPVGLAEIIEKQLGGWAYARP